MRDGMYIGALNALADLPLVKEHPAIAMISRAMVDYGPTPMVDYGPTGVN